MRRTSVVRRAADVEARFRELTTAPLRRGLVATLAAGLLTVAALLHPVLVALVVLVAVIFFATGWMRLLGLPSRRRGIPVIFGIGLLAVVVVLVTRDADHLVLTVAAAIIAAFLLEMSRTDGRPRLVEDVSGLVSGCVVALCGAGWITVSELDPVLTVTAALVLAAVSALAAIPVAGRRVVLASPVVGLAVAFLAHLAAVEVLVPRGVPGLATATVLVLGASVGLLAGSVQVILSWLPSSGRRRAAMAAALTPVLLIGVPLELVARFLA